MALSRCIQQLCMVFNMYYAGVCSMGPVLHCDLLLPRRPWHRFIWPHEQLPPVPLDPHHSERIQASSFTIFDKPVCPELIVRSLAGTLHLALLQHTMWLTVSTVSTWPAYLPAVEASGAQNIDCEIPEHTLLPVLLRDHTAGGRTVSSTI